MAVFNNRIVSTFNEDDSDLSNDPRQLAIRYIQRYERYKEEIPKEILDIIEKDKDLSFVYSIQLIKNKDEIPDKILNNIIYSDVFEGFLNAIKQFGMNKKIIEKVVKSVPGNSRASFMTMKFLYDNDIKIPDHLKIASAEYVDKENKEIEYAHMLEWKNIPENVLDAIEIESYVAYKYADNVLHWKNIPEPILKSIAYGTDTAFKYAKDILKGKDVPDVVINTITDNEENTIEYAIFLHKNGIEIPEKIVDAILDQQTYIDNYIDTIGWKNIPEDILKKIFVNSSKAVEYATKELHGENVPDFVIRKISESHYASADYAEAINFKDVPSQILNAIFTSRYKDNYLHSLFLNYKDKIIELMNNVLTTDEAKILTMEDPSPLETDDPERVKQEAIEKVKDMLKEPRYAMPYAYNVLRGKNVPDFIVGVVSKNPYYATELLNTFNHFGFFSTPQETTLKIASTNVPHNAVIHVKELFQNNDIDEIPEKYVDVISQIPRQVLYILTMYDVMRKLKEIPQKFIDSLKTDPDTAYRLIETYESAMGLNRVPKELIDAVYKDIMENMEYISVTKIEEFIKNFILPLNGTIPEELIDKIAETQGVFRYIGANIAKIMISHNIKMNDKFLHAILKDEMIFTDILEHVDKLPDYIIDKIHENKIRSYNYAQKLGWSNVPEDILNSALKFMSDDSSNITNFNLVEKYPQFYDKLKDSKNFQRWYALPKKFAEKHNKEWGGLLFHAMDTVSQAAFTIDVDEDKELCISTFDSNNPFRGGVILVGRGPIRLLFDFDCYSLFDDSGLRYATSQGEELLKQDIEGIEELSREQRIKRAGFEQIGDTYYDEGFILPSKVEWLCVTGNDDYAVKKVSEIFNLPMFNIEKFNKIIKRGEINILYDIIRGTEELPSGPSEYDEYTIDKPKSDKFKSLKRGKGKKPKSKKVKRQDKRKLVAVEEELKESLRNKLRDVWF